jgi:hypothetical protein
MSSNEEREKSDKGRRVTRGGIARIFPFPPSYLRTFTPASVLVGIVVLATLGWIAVALWGDRQRAWGILLTDFLFLSCLSAGLVVWPAIVVVSRGRWMGSTQNAALAGVFLLPVCLVILIVLAAGAAAWAPWMHQKVENSWWLNAPFLFTRDIVGLAIFSGLALWFVAAMWKKEDPPRKLAAWLIFVYTIVFSILGIDLAMGLDPHWYSLVFGIYFFISGLYIAVAAWVLTTALADPKATPDQRDDQAKLMITFCLLTTYMMYSQLLPIWYENMPKETRALVPRLNWVTDWPAVSTVLLAVFYLGPLVLFLPRRGKRSRPYVAVVAALVLSAMWLERWWLVMPTLFQPLAFGPAEIVGVAGLLAGYLLFAYWVRGGLVKDDG